MFQNYLTTAFRALRKFKLFTLLNIFGLGTGMACSILIILWVQDERSYDKFNDKAAGIYRITANVAGTPAAVTPPPLLTAIKQQMPIVESVTRVVPINANITIGSEKFAEKNIYYADPNFLLVFSYPLLHGEKHSVLSRPNGVVITEAAAIKYFGTSDVIGKVIHVDNDIDGHNYQVSGVLKNVPHNSHLQFSMLLPIDLYNRSNGQVWDNFAAYSYIKLDKRFKATTASIKTLEQQIDVIYKSNDNTNTKSSFTFQPLTEIHLHSNLVLDVDGQGNYQYVAIFFLVALFILLLACINFMNLSTALSSQRAKEVGLRKTIGALRGQLIAQFMTESILVALLSMIVSCVLSVLLLPVFNELSGKALTVQLLNIKLVGTLLGLAITVGIISGSYPAFVMSSFSPSKVLKGLKIIGGQKSYLRNGLVVFQFAIATILIVSTIVVNYQLRFIKSRDMGYNKENLLYLQMPKIGDLRNNYRALKSVLAQVPEFTDYTLINQLPTNLASATNDVTWLNKDPQLQILFPHISIDGRFLQTFGMHLLTGRGFDKQIKEDESNYLVNEKAAKLMGFTASNAVGQKISSKGHEGYIIGVVKDFNFKPVQQPIEPLIMKQTNNGGYLVLRTNQVRLQPVVAKLREIFDQIYPTAPFAYGFVDQDLSKLYIGEQRMGVLFNTFSIVSIIVSCLGLFGLATFATQRRIKEIGVRRVLGAGVFNVVGILIKDFVKLVLLSLTIAFPVAWYAMDNWLSNYAFRVQLNWWIFAIAGSLAIIVALLTISYQSVKAALSNPVRSLRAD